ncbi:MAG: hypothetical protein P9L99_18125 [Candidatus Lernaella stagnicola]|nr:hypothetical protein [Candidatus Lernaella stagnicola]
MKRIILSAVLIVVLVAASACSLEKPGVEMQAYQPVSIPNTFDVAAAQRLDDGVTRAGVKVVDITPYDRRAWIAGFEPMRKSRGVLDPVTARILYFHDGRNAVVLISIDCVGMMNADVRRLRALITKNFPHRVHVIATHNHEGPDTMGFWGPGLLTPVRSGVDTDWLDKTFQDIALGVDEAIRGAVPVRIATGTTEIDPQWSSNIWFPHPTGPIDRRMSVLRVEKIDGTPLATVANFACHAETLLSNKKISADFPGRFYKYCEQNGGGVGIFYNGALGGMISPRIARFDDRKKFPKPEQKIAWMDDMGRALADAALRAVVDRPRHAGVPIDVRTVDVPLRIRNARFVGMFRCRIISSDPERVQGQNYITEVTAVRIGGAHFALIPGEPFPELGRKFKAAMPYAEVPFVVGLANDELGYIMMPHQWTDPTYSYETTMSTGRYTGRIIFDAFTELLEN